MKIKSIFKAILTNSIFYLIISLLFLEIIIRINVFQNIKLSIIYIFLNCIGVGCLFGILARLFKEKVNSILQSIFLFVFGLYFAAQILYFAFFKTFLTLYSLSNGGQVAEFYKDIIHLIFSNILWILLCLTPFFLFVFYIRKRLDMTKLDQKKLLYSFITLILGFGIGYGLLYIPTSSLNPPLDLYRDSTINELTINELGLLTSARLDFQSFLFGKSQNVDVDEPEEKAPEEIVYDPQTMTIDFDALINDTQNNTIKSMHQYFKSVTPTQKNEYTGMFKDYNVIQLTCEGFSPYAIDKDLTPTLYKLQNEGFVFNNFYTPLWNVSTSDGEYVALQGLIPKAGGTWSFKASSNNSLPLTLGRQFEKLGYKTTAYHNHSYTYYARNLSHPNLGYDFKAPGHGLSITKQWPESDLEMIQNSVNDYINEDYFHTYYMTVSGHTNYTWSGNNMAKKNKSLVSHLNYSELAKGYLATQIELDRAMKSLLDSLEAAGKLDNTLIVMSADHYPYGLPSENYNELAGHELEQNFELYKNSFIIWSGSMKEPITVDKLGCSLDILPTVSNLLGLEYDSRLLMGTDLLSNSDPLVIFENKSFMTDKVKYNSKTQEATWLNGATEDQEYLQKINKIVKQKIEYSTLILDNNYYKSVFNTS